MKKKCNSFASTGKATHTVMISNKSCTGSWAVRIEIALCGIQEIKHKTKTDVDTQGDVQIYTPLQVRTRRFLQSVSCVKQVELLLQTEKLGSREMSIFPGARPAQQLQDAAHVICVKNHVQTIVRKGVGVYLKRKGLRRWSI